MRVLLTGSSGWLGRFLAPALRDAGHEVVGFDIVPGAETQVLGSVADVRAVDRAFSTHEVDGVVHAGALHKPDIVRYPRQAFVDVNVTGTLNLLEAAAAAGVDRFVFTSTTSLMITRAISEGRGVAAAWLDEATAPLEPRNIYGVTKLAAEGLCRMISLERGLSCIVLRTSRFFPEDDDTHRGIGGQNLKANEMLYRRVTVEDVARAHVLALERGPEVGFDVLIISAPTPFTREDAVALKQDPQTVIARCFPDAAALFAARGWTLPSTIDRVYDASRAEQSIGFRAVTDYGSVLDALREGRDVPLSHDPEYVSPLAKLPDCQEWAR
ncbi:NAD-dependent epimerase/dehydratase family protein [Mycolicibacterium baixiangningiae]|uniref:NAD-dependent epimerase/dehydratase family protein n=1 Tax=Mycolicibacterium baixiangningiae TaxID=2761578 RepID=UPI0018D15525|nr:NAD(P)-dependent oxidoreductase [Mycolicibacterium baixiangningiae]